MAHSFEFSTDPQHVEEGERLVLLGGRAFPTIVVSWRSTVLGQEWLTTLVLDYTIPLPPLEPGTTFNEVRLGAYTGDVPTKFLYFGTELGASAPRVAPQMENVVTLAGSYQEYRLVESECPLPYLELISSMPRIFGNGPQDYYSPPIKVERFDAVMGPSLIVDSFAKSVAGLDVTRGEILVDPSEGFWHGARFAGPKKMAIRRQGVVVGLRQRTGSAEREVIPPEVVRRDPRSDVRDAWVAIDLGSVSTVVAIGRGEGQELLRVGTAAPAATPADYESPSEVRFTDLARTMKAWQDRVILPLTEASDVSVGVRARAERLAAAPGEERARATRASIAGLTECGARLEAGYRVFASGLAEPEHPIQLARPAPPVLDEDGISPDDPFDPLELFAYYLGLHINTRARGLYLRYSVGMPTGWAPHRREQVLHQLRRGLFRSLPAGMVAFDDVAGLEVLDAGPNVLSFAAYGFRLFDFVPRGEPIPFVAIDAGALETAVLCGYYRAATPVEVGMGCDRVVEHTQPLVLHGFGGEALLGELAYRAYALSVASMHAADVPYCPGPGEAPLPGMEALLSDSLEAQTNARLMKEALRPLLEKVGPSPMPDALHLFARNGSVVEVPVLIDRGALGDYLRGRLDAGAAAIQQAIDAGFQQITRAGAPYAAMRAMLGGRLAMHPFLQERLEARLPPGVRIHKFREPDGTNLGAPTVKLATALGILERRRRPFAPTAVRDERAGFGYRVGRAKQGRFVTVLDASSGYDAWREFGPCTRPEVTVLYGELHVTPDGAAADDPAVRALVCDLGHDAVGYRVYLRAITGTRVELSIGPPGGRPDEHAPVWGLDLTSGAASRA